MYRARTIFSGLLLLGLAALGLMIHKLHTFTTTTTTTTPVFLSPALALRTLHHHHHHNNNNSNNNDDDDDDDDLSSPLTTFRRTNHHGGTDASSFKSEKSSSLLTLPRRRGASSRRGNAKASKHSVSLTLPPSRPPQTSSAKRYNISDTVKPPPVKRYNISDTVKPPPVKRYNIDVTVKPSPEKRHDINSTVKPPSEPHDINSAVEPPQAKRQNTNNSVKPPSEPLDINSAVEPPQAKRQNTNNSVKPPSEPHSINNKTTVEQPPPPTPTPTPTPTPPAATTDENQHKLLCITWKCRLGNQLFEYASVLGLARKLHRTPVFTPSTSGILKSALHHPPPDPTAEQAERCRAAQWVMEKNCCSYDEKFLELDPRKDYAVGKYLQSWKYFEGQDAFVRKAVAFKTDVQRQAEKEIDDLRNRCNKTLVGVHIRRGDFLRADNVKKGYRTPPAGYYLKAMDYMRRRFRNVTFLVSVDNTTWFRDSVTSAGDVIVLKRHKPAVDMALLASLDHVVTSSGTFSWWVGYLNKGVTVYWKDFIAKGTHIGKAFGDGTSFIYPGWVPL
ncbi:uncharacterized protein LOC143276598 [Babylonia areolata]|uniref:uncharacterized protein LOC143276598 n=1 Tax=Babylonia areolata TaxID=304850 RepID=UPI003FD01B0D